MSSASRKHENAMAAAGSYAEWLQAAKTLDRLEGKDRWRQEKESAEYDFQLIDSRAALLHRLRRRKDYDDKSAHGSCQSNLWDSEDLWQGHCKALSGN